MALDLQTLWERAFTEATLAGAAGDVPVGAVLVDSTGTLLAAGGNEVERTRNPTAHAEILVLQRGAQALGRQNLSDTTLIVTLEPCAMCAGAIAWARVETLYFGAFDPKSGGVEHGARVFDHPTCHHRPNVYGGFHEQRSAALLKDFFNRRRDSK